ncbi:valine--tRNA ligase [Leptospira sp. GIMC2001]|uniref:valine--tRNA ligase n=1 Tax=Leptospira sp. GIMC2001 TaxID=1513297 RepID=UPI0023497CA0|nr:valine--tRNA ligase [Leptospira sp. GIMC2001]WCL49078.1 valine--tRNA ligase [Leptospira sp. GIMC2001]
MKKEISDRYEPESVERKWRENWEKNPYFEPIEDSSNGNFSITIPPPNVTGFLHIGHALNHTIQDIIIRLERKKGKSTVWVPGMDHAGIATQMVVERELAKEGKKRTDYTREEFIDKVWEWKAHSGGQITNQQRLLGESVDWSRSRFTFDDGLSKAVIKVFRSLYDEGLIYRGARIINWCPVSKTAISDIEVEYKEKQGKLYHIRYPFADPNDTADNKNYIIVATTRPETMLGDVAVCANPEDPRYKSLQGKSLKLPLTDREIPLLYDGFVDQGFGSGLVKITPAHDPNDFEAGQRLGLTPILIMNLDGTMNELCGKYAGLDRFAARKQIVDDLESQGLIEKIENHTHSVGHNQRGGAVIEPILSTQWFVKIEPLAKPAIDAVRTGKVEFIPKMWEKTYFEWMENIRDWCISRQLWWGHRIPAYYLSDGTMVVAESMEEAIALFGKLGRNVSASDITQDEDVLDTWFSSGLWAFTVHGWPEKTIDLAKFYPNSILVTGFDIIFFWVARMIMMGLKFMGDVPFHKVLIHGLVRDKDGKKFSKSMGNVVDPLDMMAKYGTDSFRFFLAAVLPEGKDILFDESRLDGYRSFCNKIWNSTRFILMNLPDDFEVIEPSPSKLEANDEWIMSRFDLTLARYEKAYSNYHFFEMASVIYEFIWGDLCDWYIELVKPRMYSKTENDSALVARQVLVSILKKSLGLLNPIMPFITEEIYSLFNDKALCVTEFPESYADQFKKVNTDLKSAQEKLNILESYWKTSKGVRRTDVLIELVNKVRAMRAELGVKPDKKCKIIVKSADSILQDIVNLEGSYILQMARAESCDLIPDYNPDKTDAIGAFSLGEIALPLSGILDLEKEKIRLEKEVLQLSTEMDKINNKLSNPGFIEKAKPEVIDKEKEKFRILSEKKEIVSKALERLG